MALEMDGDRVGETRFLTIKSIAMKTTLFIARLFLAGATLVALLSCAKDKGPLQNNNNNAADGFGFPNLQTQIINLPAGDLSENEKADLLWMREEEKLARDVYAAMYAKWGVLIFNNITESEQRHMDAVLLLINKYGLTDPASPQLGIFQNTTLQNLYNQLVATGNVSLVEAYRMGATIEDLDLSDLAKAQLRNDNADIKLVYDNLQKGSRNHLRAFYKQLVMSGVTYTAQYITQAELEAIVNSPMETGNGRRGS